MIRWKLDCQSRKQQRKNLPITRPGFIGLFFYFRLSLDHERRSHNRNRCSASGSDGLICTRSYHSALLIAITTTFVQRRFVTERDQTILDGMLHNQNRKYDLCITLCCKVSMKVCGYVSSSVGFSPPPLHPISPGRGNCHIKDGGARRKFRKEPLRDTKILFCERGLKCFSPLTGNNSKSTPYFLSYFFRLNIYPKR